MKKLLGPVGILIGLVVVLALWVMSAYNGLVTLDQKTLSQWAQVENVVPASRRPHPQPGGDRQGRCRLRERDTSPP